MLERASGYATEWLGLYSVDVLLWLLLQYISFLLYEDISVSDVFIV